MGCHGHSLLAGVVSEEKSLSLGPPLLCVFWFLPRPSTLTLMCAGTCGFFRVVLPDVLSGINCFTILIIAGQRPLFLQLCFLLPSFLSFWYGFLAVGVVPWAVPFLSFLVFSLCASFWITAISVSLISLTLFFCSIQSAVNPTLAWFSFRYRIFHLWKFDLGFKNICPTSFLIMFIFSFISLSIYHVTNSCFRSRSTTSFVRAILDLLVYFSSDSGHIFSASLHVWWFFFFFFWMPKRTFYTGEC